MADEIDREIDDMMWEEIEESFDSEPEPAPACSYLVSDVRSDGIYCQQCGRKLCGFNVEPATQYIDAAQMLSLKERTAPLLQTANTELLEQIRNLEAQLKTEKTISTAAITDLDAAMVENELLKEWAHLVQSARDVLRNQLAAMREQRDWADEAARLNYEAWQKAEATVQALRLELQGRYGFNEGVS